MLKENKRGGLAAFPLKIRFYCTECRLTVDATSTEDYAVESKDGFWATIECPECGRTLRTGTEE